MLLRLALRMPSFSNAEAEIAVAGGVKRSAGTGSITTSGNGYSAAYNTEV